MTVADLTFASNARTITSHAVRDTWASMMGQPPHPLDIPSGPLPADLIPFSAAKGSLGPVMQALSRWGLAGRLEERERTRAEVALVRAGMSVAAMRSELARILGACAAEQVDVVILKGHDLLVRYYESDTIRPVTDADLLIRRRDYPKLGRILTDAGYRTPGGERTSVWSRGGFIIDVHFAFVNDVRNPMSAFLPQIPAGEIFARAEKREIEGAAYLSPDPGHSLIITALHAMTHSYLKDYWFLDAGTLLIRNAEPSFVDRCRALAEEHRLTGVLGPMLWALREHFAFRPDSGRGKEYRVSLPVRRLIGAAMRSTDYLFFGDLLLGLSVDSYKKKFYYFKEMAFPHRDVVARERGVGITGAAPLFLSRSLHLVRSGFHILIKGRR